MNVTIVEKRPVTVEDPETKVTNTVFEMVEHVFETNACELIESAEKRFRKQFYGKPDEELDKKKRLLRFGDADKGSILARGVTMKKVPDRILLVESKV